MDAAAYREAQNNGFNPSANGDYAVNIVEYTADGVRISVRLEQDAETFFSRIIMSDPIRTAAYAEALISETGGRFCILALEEDDPSSFRTHGAVDLYSPDCGIAVNSSDEEAMTMSGNVDIEVNSVQITGDYDIDGSVDFVYNSLKTGVAPIEDPYADLDVPEFEDCDHNNKRVNKAATLSPGVYCGGLNISGNNDIELEPGVYIINGGGLNVTGQGEFIGEGVTIILTGSGDDYADVDISGGRTVELSAPLAGEDWGGIVFYQDRDAPTGNNLQNKIVGTSDVIFDGVAYFPSQGLWFGGNTNVVGEDNPCTKLIARTITMAGNPRLGNKCDRFAVEETGTPSVRLVR